MRPMGSKKGSRWISQESDLRMLASKPAPSHCSVLPQGHGREVAERRPARRYLSLLHSTANGGQGAWRLAPNPGWVRGEPFWDSQLTDLESPNQCPNRADLLVWSWDYPRAVSELLHKFHCRHHWRGGLPCRMKRVTRCSGEHLPLCWPAGNYMIPWHLRAVD